ncbi:MAG TPA: hypothetical protein PK765_06335 [bacterium]|nr:hypothetical protein [bacterium]
MESSDKKRRETLARQLRDLQSHEGWKLLESELTTIRDTLDRRILCLPLSQTDNALRYTRHDLERETRRIISNFIELPDDLLVRLEGVFESDPLS